MSLLKKLGLVEDNPDYYNEMDASEVYYEEPEVKANVEGVTNENLISDIYNVNSVNDFSKSIFKVGELIDSLPKEMATDTKRSSVLAILSSFGLTVEEVCEDGISRAALLKSSMDEIVDKNTNEIEKCNSLIEEYKKGIENLSKTVATLVEDNKNCTNKIEEEITKINNLMRFIEGDDK